MIIFQNQLASDKLVGKIVIIFNYFFINNFFADVSSQTRDDNCMFRYLYWEENKRFSSIKEKKKRKQTKNVLFYFHVREYILNILK